MQIFSFKLLLFLLLFSVSGFAQNTYFGQQSRHHYYIQRTEIKRGTFSNRLFTGIIPYERKDAVFDTSFIQQNKVEQYNYNSLLRNNLEWLPNDRNKFASKKSILKHFYTTPAHAYSHYGDDFFITADPLFHYRQSFSNEETGDNLFLNQRGVAVRGGIANQVGFSASVMDVQERGPLFFRQWEDSLLSVPGANFYKKFKGTGVDYIDARGSFTFKANRYIRFHAGYDRNFIGSGYRSLFLSDFAGNNLFVKINTRFWKLNYQNLFMELHAGAANNNVNNIVPKKYAAMHHLSLNLRPWLNIGFFEGVIFGRKDRFEFGYLNPVIFLRSIEGNLGSRDNALIGADVNALLFKRVKVYGQLFLDEFNFSKLRQDASWWGNKTGFQLGMNYVDFAGISNLDLQAEWNRVRPFTYSHFDSVSNYSHYNQPLAHPFGANFNEVIGILRYQPVGKLSLTAKLIAWKQGLDSTSGYNAGGNIFRLSGDGRVSEFGYKQLNGVEARGINASLLASYEIRENIFVDAYAMVRRFLKDAYRQNLSLFSIGLRINLWYRDYDY
ncbi:MAG: hypothetical protein ACK50E_06725 [Bacteroidota bacterium]|jgi:hypothetical protein